MAQALPLKSEFMSEHSTVLAVSVGLHLALLVMLALRLDLFQLRQPQPVRLAIQASVVDNTAIKRREAEQRQREREMQQAQERRRQEEVDRQQREQKERELKQKQAAEEQQRAAEARQQAEKARQEKLQAEREAEKRRQQDAEKARQAKVEQDRKAAEAQKQAAAEQRRQAESERRKAQAQAELARQMAEEEALLDAQDSGQLDQYAEIIRQTVERNWIRPASARPGISCSVLVRQIPGGDVVDVRVTECNGDAAVVRSIEAAVRRSSPLPRPPNPALFDRSLRFDFRPRD